MSNNLEIISGWSEQDRKNKAIVLIIIVSKGLMTLDLLAVRRHNLIVFDTVQENKYYILQEESQENLLSVHTGFGILEWICANISDRLSK